MAHRDWGVLLIWLLIIGLGVAFLLNYSVMPPASQQGVHSVALSIVPLLAAQPGVFLPCWAIYAHAQAGLHDADFRLSLITTAVVVSFGIVLAGFGMWVGEHYLGPRVVRGLELFTTFGRTS